MIGTVVGFLLKFAGSGIVDKGLEALERRAELQNDREALKAKTTVELARMVAEEGKVQADLQKSKFRFPGFWVMAFFFIGPLAMWWTAVILDSIFLFPFDVSALPAPLNDWAARMIEWLFYAGGIVGGIKTITRR